MDLHNPQDLVADLVAQHAKAFAMIQGYLDLVIPHAYSRCTDEQPDPEQVAGGVLCPNVRDLFLIKSKNPAMAAQTLHVVERPNRGIRLTDSSFNTVRLRKWPQSWASPGVLKVEIADHLFGIDLASAELEYVVLWDSHAKSMSLRRCVLALVSHLDENSKTKIYAVEDLPVRSGFMTDCGPGDALGSGTVPPSGPTDDFDDLIDGEGDAVGDDPA